MKDFKIEILAKNHVRNNFKCGYQFLDSYIQRQVSQDVKRNLAVCYVLISSESDEIIGFYTLSSNSISKNSLPLNLSKKFPQAYQSIPTVLLGRLAIDNKHKGKKLGELLLLDALNRSYKLSKQLGTIAIIVDPIDAKAQNFYKNYSFISLPSGLKMFLPMKTVEELVFI